MLAAGIIGKEVVLFVLQFDGRRQSGKILIILIFHLQEFCLGQILFLTKVFLCFSVLVKADFSSHFMGLFGFHEQPVHIVFSHVIFGLFALCGDSCFCFIEMGGVFFPRAVEIDLLEGVHEFMDGQVVFFGLIGYIIGLAGYKISFHNDKI